jgi:hypothetical protein
VRRVNPLAIASLVCGILWICWIGSLLAVVLGHLSLRQIRRRQDGGRGLAIAGLVFGYVGLLALAAALVQGGTWVKVGPGP